MTYEKNLAMIPAIVFEMRKGKLIKAFFRGMRDSSGYWKPGGPVNLKNVPFPLLVADDWVIIKTVYCGICGSDMTELKLKGALDNPIRSLISFPQVMGHEPVGIVDKVGPAVSQLKKGDRVMISPWFSCLSRGIVPQCERCQAGDYVHCKSFSEGNLPTGMHLGVTSGYGGFTPYFSVHESQCFKIPDEITLENAVLADPFSVAFHALLSLNPKPNDVILVYGLGIIGLLAIVCLKQLFKIEHVIAVGRYPFQKERALKLGAIRVFLSSNEDLIEDVANYLNLELYTPRKGLKWVIKGLDGIIDTISSPSTFEIGIRILSSRGRLVFLGINKPKRCESTPHYFKELEIVGSNAFSIEEYNGKRAHAFEFFIQFLKEGTINLPSLISHKFRLEQYQDAFNTLSNKSTSHAIKVVFDFT